MGCIQSKPAPSAAAKQLRHLQQINHPAVPIVKPQEGTIQNIEPQQQQPNTVVPLTENEIELRIEAPSHNQTIMHAGIKMTYAWVSQRGYYPDDLKKENQDAFTILPKLSNQADQALFGVFDGHGREGHMCSRYARDKVTTVNWMAKSLYNQVAQCMIQRLEGIPSSSSRVTKKAIVQAHTMANEKLHADPYIDDTLSGTTAITVLMRGTTMYISNVGDSRAIMISTLEDGSALAQPLSSDQTPYRRDERERVQSYGARILTMDQIDGLAPVHDTWNDDFAHCDGIDESGDPPRVWSPEGDYPGTAFTRSIGDSIAEELGVVAEPEILVREILPTDRYLMIASDGVYEFMTNQQVADIVASSKSPLDACRAVVSAAYCFWLRYEIRTDDITAIIIEMDHPEPIKMVEEGNGFDNASTHSLPPPPPINGHKRTPSRNELSLLVPFNPANSESNSLNPIDVKSPDGSPTSGGLTVTPTDAVLLESRPVRTTASREKRKSMILTAKDDEDEDASHLDLASLVVAKSEDDTRSILGAIKMNFLFQHLTAQQRSDVASAMSPVMVKEGDWVIRQGDIGDKFYIVDSGRYEVRVRTPNSTCEHKGGAVVHVYDSSPEHHPGFGELALMYNKPRAATIIALTSGRLWALDIRVFKKIVLKSIRVRRKVLATVRKMELLKALSLQQRQQVVDLMTQVSFPAGSYIARQGERCDNFYVIVDGECESSITTVTPTVDERHYTLLGGESDENKEAIGPPQEITGSRKIPKSASAAALAALAAAAAAGEEAQKMQMQLTQTEVARMKPNEFFCQHVLLSANSVSRRTVVAMTNMKLLYISRMTFEEYLGPLSTIIESHHKRIAAASRRTIEVPRSLAQIRLQGLITADSSGPLLLGTFGDAPLPNVMIRSFLMKEVDRLRMSNTVLTLIEGARAVAVAAQMVSHKPSSSSSAIAAYSTKTGSIHQSPHNVLVPELLSVCRDSSALHVIFNSPVVADLSSFLCANNSSGTLASHPDVIVYVAMCVISALEYLHELGILYRAIQPESLYVDSQGRIILSDYRVCKVGAVNGRTYTICGRADYLAPEMIIRQGHSGPVDFWALGLLLYELAVGKHPFAGANDLATYAKISSFGTAAFPTLPFSESVRPDMKFLIEKLLVPNPESRLGGGGSHSFAAMKSMLMFEGVDWAAMTTHPPTSPLLSLAIAECDSMTSEGVDPSLLAAFSEDYHGNGWELPALE